MKTASRVKLQWWSCLPHTVVVRSFSTLYVCNSAVPPWCLIIPPFGCIFPVHCSTPRLPASGTIPTTPRGQMVYHPELQSKETWKPDVRKRCNHVNAQTRKTGDRICERVERRIVVSCVDGYGMHTPTYRINNWSSRPMAWSIRGVWWLYVMGIWK